MKGGRKTWILVFYRLKNILGKQNGWQRLLCSIHFPRLTTPVSLRELLYKSQPVTDLHIPTRVQIIQISSSILHLVYIFLYRNDKPWDHPESVADAKCMHFWAEYLEREE